MALQLQCLRGLHILYLNIKAVISVIWNFSVLIVFFWLISKNTSGLCNCSEIYYTESLNEGCKLKVIISPSSLPLIVGVSSIFYLPILNPFCNILLPLAFAQWVLWSEHDCEFNLELLRELLPGECFVVVAFSLETSKQQQWEGTDRSHRLSSVLGKVKLSYDQHKGLYVLTFQGWLLIRFISYREFRGGRTENWRCGKWMLRMGQKCFLKVGLIWTFSNFLLLLEIELVVYSEKLAVIEGEAHSSGKHCKILRKKRKITLCLSSWWSAFCEQCGSCLEVVVSCFDKRDKILSYQFVS